MAIRNVQAQLWLWLGRGLVLGFQSPVDCAGSLQDGEGGGEGRERDRERQRETERERELLDCIFVEKSQTKPQSSLDLRTAGQATLFSEVATTNGQLWLS